MEPDAPYAVLAIIVLAIILVLAGWAYRHRNRSGGGTGTSVPGDMRGRDDHPDADLR